VEKRIQDPIQKWREKKGIFLQGLQNISVRIAKKTFSAGPSRIYARNVEEY